MNQNNAKSPPEPTAVGLGGQNTNNAKKPRRDPTVPQRYRGSSAVRGDSEDIDFLGLHLDTKTNIASQWDAFIDTKTTYNHFLNIKLKCTIRLLSTATSFRLRHTPAVMDRAHRTSSHLPQQA